MELLRVDLGRTMVLVLPASVDASTFEAIVHRSSEELDSNDRLETVHLDCRKVVTAEEDLLRAVHVWARALDDENVILRIRRPQPAVRAAMVSAGLADLIVG